eukprot:9181641-Alexandrium_andersonii.AAC.1
MARKINRKSRQDSYPCPLHDAVADMFHRLPSSYNLRLFRSLEFLATSTLTTATACSGTDIIMKVLGEIRDHLSSVMDLGFE